MNEFREEFADVSGKPWRTPQLWKPVVFSRASIEREIARLAAQPAPANGRRASLVVHPSAQEPGRGLAPGIDVTINVLRPGERTAWVRRNSSQVDLCIGGRGLVRIGDRAFGVERFDVWNTPSMQPYSCENVGDELMVRLSYSNAPLLEKLEVHYVEENPDVNAFAARTRQSEASSAMQRRARDLALNVAIGADGARLLGYEYLIDIDTLPIPALHWPWKLVREHFPTVREIASGYTGRHLLVLYNPATERRIGSTSSFFAVVAAFPPERVDIPHRHVSAAINYILAGDGWSKVSGERFEWAAGDLMLSAPGWAIHGHAAGKQGCEIFTVQDHPLHLAMESLVWQEKKGGPILNLGAQSGFETNLEVSQPS